MPKKVTSLEEILERRKSTVQKAAASGDKSLSITKVFSSPASFTKAEGQRSARFVMSTETTDRYGDIVRQAGMDMTEFLKNPIALWMHRHAADPLGTWDDVKVVRGSPKRTEGTLNFAPEGEFDDVDKVARYVELGIYRACSIGFMSKDYDLILDDEGRWSGGIDFKASELTECSVVAVGANQEALAKAADMDKSFVLDVLEDVLDNWAKTADGLIVPRDQFEKVYSEISAKTISTPELVECAVNSPDEDSDEVEAIVVAIDTKDAEKQIDSLTKKIEGLIKKAGQLAGLVPQDPVEPEYVEGSMEKAKALQESIDQKLAETEAA